MTTASTPIRTDSCLPRCASCRASGVSIASCSATSAEMRPISVPAPSRRPRPRRCRRSRSSRRTASTSGRRSPRRRSFGLVDLLAATDSPVRADSSTCSWAESSSRTSAGTRSPPRTRTTSPTTRVAESTTPQSPSRRTCASQRLHLAQPRQRRRGPALLDEPDQARRDDHHDDHREVDPVAGDRLEHRRRDQDVDEDVGVLAQQAPPAPTAAAARAARCGRRARAVPRPRARSARRASRRPPPAPPRRAGTTARAARRRVRGGRARRSSCGVLLGRVVTRCGHGTHPCSAVRQRRRRPSCR